MFWWNVKLDEETCLFIRSQIWALENFLNTHRGNENEDACTSKVESNKAVGYMGSFPGISSVNINDEVKSKHVQKLKTHKHGNNYDAVHAMNIVKIIRWEILLWKEKWMKSEETNLAYGQWETVNLKNLWMHKKEQQFTSGFDNKSWNKVFHLRTVWLSLFSISLPLSAFLFDFLFFYPFLH